VTAFLEKEKAQEQYRKFILKVQFFNVIEPKIVVGMLLSRLI